MFHKELSEVYYITLYQSNLLLVEYSSDEQDFKLQ